MDAIAADHEHKRGSSKNLRVHFDVPSKEVEIEPPVSNHQKTSGSSSSSPSSSSSSPSSSPASSMDVAVVDQTVVNGPAFESEKDNGLEMEGLASPSVSDPSPVWSNQSGSGAQSPSIQLMGRPAGYDPNRIPSSIFSSKSTTPMEWSVASNESLFSIHIGNSSFSRDHFIMFNNRSGEIPRSDELMMASAPGPLPRLPPSEPDKTKTADVATEAANETNNAVWKGSPKDDHKGRATPVEDVGYYNTVSYRSDESNASTRSFHFPFFAGDSGINSPAALDLEMQYPPRQQQLQQQQQHQSSKPARAYWYHDNYCILLGLVLRTLVISNQP
ncbi:uncharacterized protein LOC132182149 [Corylus avellana]|uniref:uncharacterized protein LOC132182149 n=1 Tax=Corylus avellana TaxID=13451 RepID=UPI00286CE975|nr:uncharacterized protein LOC132182149 [Corylus avellana]